MIKRGTLERDKYLSIPGTHFGSFREPFRGGRRPAQRPISGSAGLREEGGGVAREILLLGIRLYTILKKWDWP